MTAPVVVFAIGNPSRGDDAIGPVLLKLFGEWLVDEGLADRIELVEDFQLQIEHALDLQGRQQAVFIDAGVNLPAPFLFERIYPSTAVAHTTHALSPQAVLQVYKQTEGLEPPLAFVLGVRGERFELGEGLSPEAERRVAAALDFLKTRFRDPKFSARV